MSTELCGPPTLPSVTVTRFAVVVCAAKLRLDALGLVANDGKIVSRLAADPFPSVPLSTAAVAVAGIWLPAPTLVTWRVRVSPGPNAPPLVRVSRIRYGGTAV